MTNQSQIVKNDLNYTLYYNVLNYFRTIMKNHPSIGFVSQGDIFDLDTKTFPSYPLGNVLVGNTNFGESYTDYNIQLIIADRQKLLQNESTGTNNQQSIPFYGDNDVVDIHANTLAILNDLTSYTARNVSGFEILGNISCVPFRDRFDNGLAGWSATFDLRVHNDRNRCIFFLINPSGSGYIIEECNTGEQYKAVLSNSGSIGQVFSTKYIPNSSVNLDNYSNLFCYTIVEEFNDRDDWDFVNLPILPLPLENYLTCENCELWINPKKWGTTPAMWAGVEGEIRKWGFV